MKRLLFLLVIVCVNFGAVVAQELPIGTIIASVVPPDRINGNNTIDIWHLADGSRITGKTYNTVMGQSIAQLPDLRCMFLRGMNHPDESGNPREGNYADPDNRRRVGSLQASQVGPHNHQVGINGTDTNAMSVGGAAQRLAQFNSHNAGAYGAGNPKRTETNENVTESRPNNVAVYYYIKIN